MESTRLNVVFLNCTTNYGRSFAAANYKTEMLAKGLEKQGDFCTLHSGIHESPDIVQREDYIKPSVGRIIQYPYKGSRLTDFFRNMGKLYADLKNLRSDTAKNILIMNSPFVHIHFLYVIMGNCLGYHVSNLHQEWLPTLKNVNAFRRFSASIISRFLGLGTDSFLPISEYIIAKTKHFNKPYLKTPVLSEYSEHPGSGFDRIGFTYCATVEYVRVLNVLLDGYKEYSQKVDNPQPLSIILSGNINKIEKLKEQIAADGLSSNIKILTRIPYNVLRDIYKSSSALILPLDPGNIQDHARFSQKIAEYLSTGTPMITTLVGEIPHYFTWKKDAVITDFSAEGFADAFKWIHNNPEEARNIGENGFCLGKQEFDTYSFGKKLHDFFCRV